jgi:hypothetical protein
MVSAAEVTKETGLISPDDEVFGRYWGQSGSLDLSVDITAATSGRSSSCTFSERGSFEKPSWSARSIPFSPNSQWEADNEWRKFSPRELYYHCHHISGNRPAYSTHAQNQQPKKPVVILPESKPSSEQLSAEGKQELSKIKHAGAERDRREIHRRRLVEQYARLPDYPLEKARWKLDSTEAPTKEIIMHAGNIHAAMLEGLKVHENSRSVQELARRDQAIEAWERTYELLKGKNEVLEDKYVMLQGMYEKCRLSLDSLRAQSIAPYAEDHAAARAPVQHRDRVSLARVLPAPNASIANQLIPTSTPTRTLQNLSESFQSYHAGYAKRKRQEDEEETTPTGPLRQEVAKQSHDFSPRSATSSRSSWCLVENTSFQKYPRTDFCFSTI